MKKQLVREEYVAPKCAVLSFQVEENVNAEPSSKSQVGKPEFDIGDDAEQEDA